MDRYSGREGFDDDAPRAPMPAVAKSGLSSFVKADQGMSQGHSQPLGKVEISVSRREQKRRQGEEAAMAPPPPPHAASSQPARTSGQMQVPVWAGQPPPGYKLRVLKDSAVISELRLDRPMTVFGRGAVADVHLDHQSISRQHAAVCYQRMTGKWMVLDWGSVHGTFVDGKQLAKDVPVELREGSLLRFAASSRAYSLQRPNSGNSAPMPRADIGATQTSGYSGGGNVAEQRKRARDQESDDTEHGSHHSEKQLPKDPGPRVDNSGGQFANLVATAVVKSKDGSAPARRLLQTREAGGVSRRPAALQPLGLRTGLYDHLPPATK